MHKIYLLCTRAAISGSSLAYIINQSPDFYNTPHNNVWDEEQGDVFGTAYTINDWWNLDDVITKTIHYNQEFRNTEALDQDQLIQLVDGFKKLNLQKNICLFTHARNIKQLKQIINTHNLPIVIVSTIMGEKCGMFVNSWIKREYSNEMNKFDNLFDTWEYLYTQRLSNDKLWEQHADYTFKMHDYLVETDIVYSKLGITPNKNISTWTSDYLLKNNKEVESLKESCKQLSTLLHLYDILESQCKEHHEKLSLCYNLFEMVHDSASTDIPTLQSQYNKTY